MDENHVEPIVDQKDLPANKSDWSKPELQVLDLNEALSADGTGLDVTSGRRHVFS